MFSQVYIIPWLLLSPLPATWTASRVSYYSWWFTLATKTVRRISWSIYFLFLPKNSNVKIFAKKVEVILINEVSYAAVLDNNIYCLYGIVIFLCFIYSEFSKTLSSIYIWFLKKPTEKGKANCFPKRWHTASG